MSSEEVLCVVLTCLYALLFLSSVLQLLRIVSAQHDVWSFQCGFLLLAVLWSAARAFFFGESFGLPPLLSLLLWWLPFDLQLATFSLLIVFYGSLLHHSRWHHGSSKRTAYAAVLVLVNVTVPVLTTAWAVTSVLQSRAIATLESVHHAYMACQLFALFAVFLYHSYRLHASPATAHLLASLLRPLFPLSLLTTLCLTVFLSRAIFALLNCVGLYGLEIGGDAGGWKVVSPVSFVLLSLWEVLPTAAVILFFHHIPSSGRRKWQWCGERGSASSGQPGGRAAAARGGGGGGGGGGGDGESERSGSPHSASSRLSYNTADELDADLLHSGSSLSSHSFSSSMPPAAQHSHSHSHFHSQHQHPQSAFTPAFSSPPAATAAPSLSSASSVFHFRPSHGAAAQPPALLPPPPASHLRPPKPSSQHPPPHPPSRPAHPIVSSPPAAASAGPFPVGFSASFSPSSPLFASPVGQSPSLSPSAAGAETEVRHALYDRAAERWRVRREGGLLGAVDGGAAAAGLLSGGARAGAAVNARSLAASEDEDEYEYRASLDYDL